MIKSYQEAEDEGANDADLADAADEMENGEEEELEHDPES